MDYDPKKDWSSYFLVIGLIFAIGIPVLLIIAHMIY